MRGHVREVPAKTKHEVMRKPEPAAAAEPEAGEAPKGEPAKKSAPGASSAAAAAPPTTEAASKTPSLAAASSAPDAADASPAGGEKKPPVSSAWAKLLERENQLTEKARRLKPLEEAFEVAKTSKLKALEKLGWTLEELQEEYLSGTTEKTPEQLAREVAGQEYERRQTAERERQEREQQEQNQRVVAESVDSLRAAVGVVGGARLPVIMALSSAGVDVYPEQIASWWAKSHNRLPGKHEADQVLLAYEAHLASQFPHLASKSATPATVVAAPAVDNKPAPATDNKPAVTTINSTIAGEVPLRSAAPRRGESPLEVARRLAQEAGLPW